MSNFSFSKGTSLLGLSKVSRLRKRGASELGHKHVLPPISHDLFILPYDCDICCRWSWWLSIPDTCRPRDVQTKEDLRRSAKPEPLLYIHTLYERLTYHVFNVKRLFKMEDWWTQVYIINIYNLYFYKTCKHMLIKYYWTSHEMCKTELHAGQRCGHVWPYGKVCKLLPLSR